MNKFRTRRFALAALAVAVVALGSFVIWQAATARPGASDTHAGAVSAEKTKVFEGLQQDLQSADAPEARNNLQAKLNALDAEATRQAAAAAKGATKPQDVCKAFPREQDSGQPPAPGGIFERDVLIPGNEDVRVSNLWTGQYAGQTWVLYAGATDTGAGVLVLATTDGSFTQRFDLPDGAGAARIVAEKDSRLEINVSDSGAPLYFDIPARALAADAKSKLTPQAPLPTPIPQTGLCD
jgi:hypothetical protein